MSELILRKLNFKKLKTKNQNPNVFCIKLGKSHKLLERKPSKGTMKLFYSLDDDDGDDDDDYSQG